MIGSAAENTTRRFPPMTDESVRIDSESTLIGDISLRCHYTTTVLSPNKRDCLLSGVWYLPGEQNTSASMMNLGEREIHITDVKLVHLISMSRALQDVSQKLTRLTPIPGTCAIRNSHQFWIDSPHPKLNQVSKASHALGLEGDVCRTFSCAWLGVSELSALIP